MEPPSPEELDVPCFGVHEDSNCFLLEGTWEGIPDEGRMGELGKGVKVGSAPGKASEAFKVCSVSRGEFSMMKEPIALEQANQEAGRRVVELDINCGCKS